MFEPIARWLIVERHYAWLMVVGTLIGLSASLWALLEARKDVAIVRVRLQGDRREDRATLMLAEHRVRAEGMRIAAQLLLFAWAVVTVALPTMGPEMTGRLVVLLGSRAVLLLGVSVVMLGYVLHDRRDHWRIVRFVRAYRDRRLMGR